MDDSKKKIAIVSVCSLILVAMVVALVGGVNRNGEGQGEEQAPDLSTNKKAFAAICQNTDYQQTCVDSLNESGVNSSDPVELIKAIFQAATKYVDKAVQNSTTLEEVQKDPKAKAAYDTCQELARDAVRDLERSFDKFSSFDITNIDDMLMDLKTWLSGAITQQETCLDGFDEVDGEAGMKMREALTTGMQMSSNALAMVEEMSRFLEGMGIQSFNSRRLLASEGLAVVGHGDELPDWLDFNERKMLAAAPQKIKPNLVVAKDGSGQFRTINEALMEIPKKGNETFVLYIKEGIYNEKVKINSSFTHVMMVGDGPTRTRITGNLNFIDGTPTYHTATVAVQGDGFIAKEIGFENSAGPGKHQAVALRVSADKTIFYNCHMDGYQDTLYVHAYRQFYRNCSISGTIDFIFGDSAAVFQNCKFLVRRPLDNQQNIVTAQGRKDLRQPTGLVLQNCTFTADKDLLPVKHRFKTYLARPWKEYSRTVIMESFLDDLIHPEGYLPWNATFALETLFYTEFNNRGPAAPKMMRVKWPGIKELPAERIRRFTASAFIDGNRWVLPKHIPYTSGFFFPVPKEDPNVKYSPVGPEENKDLGALADRTTAGAAAAALMNSNTLPDALAPSTSNPAAAPAPAGSSPAAPSPAPSANPATAPQSGIAAAPQPSSSSLAAGAPAPSPSGIPQKVSESSAFTLSIGL